MVATIRDYDTLLHDKPRATQPNVFNSGKRITFQVWDWADGSDIYMVNQFIVQDINGKWETKHFTTYYRALQRQELSAVLISSGFVDVRWHMPEESGFYQPIVTARKPPTRNRANGRSHQPVLDKLVHQASINPKRTNCSSGASFSLITLTIC